MKARSSPGQDPRAQTHNSPCSHHVVAHLSSKVAFTLSIFQSTQDDLTPLSTSSNYCCPLYTGIADKDIGSNVTYRQYARLFPAAIDIIYWFFFVILQTGYHTFDFECFYSSSNQESTTIWEGEESDYKLCIELRYQCDYWDWWYTSNSGVRNKSWACDTSDGS